jgi:hypothetical protein
MINRDPYPGSYRQGGPHGTARFTARPPHPGRDRFRFAATLGAALAVLLTAAAPASASQPSSRSAAPPGLQNAPPIVNAIQVVHQPAG